MTIEARPVLDRNYIRGRLAAATRAAPRGDHDLNPDWPLAGVPEDRLIPAAVLVPIIDHLEAPHVLLTKRVPSLRAHAGQISFPGGRIDDTDADPVAAALREAQEEIGLSARHVEIAGTLAPYRTGTGYAVTPVVGLVRPGFALTPNPAEVSEAFEVPLAFLIDPANRRRHSGIWKGQRRQYYAMPYQQHYIWGATAAMLVNLADILLNIE